MDSNQQELVAQFCGITGASASTAQTTLEAADYDLEAAISLFYAASEGQAEQEDAPVAQQPAAPQPAAASSASQPRRAPQNNSKLRTLKDLQASANDEDEEDDKDQDLFAGGEKSGLAVQNPNSGNSAADHFRNILNRARRNPERPPAEAAEEQPQRASHFTGRAQTLGGDEAESRVIEDPTTSRRQRPAPERITRTLHLWADGISVDDGPLIRFDDPANAHIVAQINQGRAPLSLLDVAPDQEVDLNLEPHKDQNYVQPKKVYKPFGGSGQRLGSPTPGIAPVTAPAASSQPAADATSTTQSAPTIKLDESAPTVTLQIRLGNGSRLTNRFNTTHTIGDVYGFVDQTIDEASQRPYVLVTTFPTRELSDRQQNLSDVGELKRGGTVQQKYL